MTRALRRVVPLVFAVCVNAHPIAAESRLAAVIEVNVQALVRADMLTATYTDSAGGHEALLERFVRYSKDTLGVPVYFVPLVQDTGGLQGLMSCPVTIDERRICVLMVDTSRNGTRGQLATLLHELAHMAQKNVSTTHEAELWAESVKWLTLTELGVNTTRATMSYFAQFPQAMRDKFFDAREREIRALVADLVKVGKCDGKICH